MNEFEAWQKIMSEWKEVNRMKKLNQELYDILGGAIIYISKYAEKNTISLPNRDAINRMASKIHCLIDEINISSETPNLNKKNFDDSNPSNLPVLDVKFW